MRRLSQVGLIVALLLVGRAARADDLRERDRYIERRYAMMGTLTAWSVASLAVGTVALVADPFAPRKPAPGRAAVRQSFGAITVVYALLNGAIAVSSLAAIPHERDLDARRDLFPDDKRRLTQLFAANFFADIVYTTVGALLYAHPKAIFGSPSSPLVRGTGLGFLTQGAFLLAFDGSGALLSR